MYFELGFCLIYDLELKLQLHDLLSKHNVKMLFNT